MVLEKSFEDNKILTGFWPREQTTDSIYAIENGKILAGFRKNTAKFKGDEKMRFWKNLWNDESGAVATEYIILTGLIAIALIAVVILFREKLMSLINGFVQKLQQVG